MEDSHAEENAYKVDDISVVEDNVNDQNIPI